MAVRNPSGLAIVNAIEPEVNLGQIDSTLYPFM
jgi:hypothetical protein